MKKKTMYGDIHVRNMPTDFEKYPNIGCGVTGVDGRTDRRCDTAIVDLKIKVYYHP